MKKKLWGVMLCVLVCISTVIPQSIFAETQGNGLPQLNENDVKEVVSNEKGRDDVEEVLQVKEIDGKTMGKLDNIGDVSVEQIDEDFICVNVDVDEPTKTIIYDDGTELQEREQLSLIVENESDVSTGKCVAEMKDVIRLDSEKKIDSNQNIIKPASASDLVHQEETLGPVCKVKLRKRIKYSLVQTGNKSPAETWFKFNSTSSYIVSTTYKIKSLKLSNLCRGYGCTDRNPKNIKLQSYSNSGTAVQSPKTGTYYSLTTNATAWFNGFYDYYAKATTEISYIKDGKTVNTTFATHYPI
ncbi:hypothetical protein [Emergencia timonensis]|uniref:hypothetical protein n=1 Tax=Emergencia timonensis TaxID=1776384 RepID=UPI003995A44E